MLAVQKKELQNTKKMYNVHHEKNVSEVTEIW